MTSTPVKLYVYDLSNGLARQLSLALTGRQIDGIWHTSVVVYNMEIFYGRGISVTLPGGSHHGTPLHVLDIGQTEVDKETLTEYIAQMREEYTADKYHLLDWNCNTFSNACIEFLTGGSIPAYITSLPTDFLSTPFGAALRPTIDAMFRPPPQAQTQTQTVHTGSGLLTPPPDDGLSTATAAAAAAASPNPVLAASLLQAVSAQATFAGEGESEGCHLPTPQRTSPPSPSPEDKTGAGAGAGGHDKGN